MKIIVEDATERELSKLTNIIRAHFPQIGFEVRSKDTAGLSLAGELTASEVSDTVVHSTGFAEDAAFGALHILKEHANVLEGHPELLADLCKVYTIAMLNAAYPVMVMRK
jgi:hypothetical protein